MGLIVMLGTFIYVLISYDLIFISDLKKIWNKYTKELWINDHIIFFHNTARNKTSSSVIPKVGNFPEILDFQKPGKLACTNHEDRTLGNFDPHTGEWGGYRTYIPP